MSEVWLIASGPSAHDVIPPPGVSIACVNGSIDLVEGDPDFYGVFENKAAIAYKHRIATSDFKVYMRDHAARELNWKDAGDGAYAVRTVRQDDGFDTHFIGFQFGPPDLWHLHRDRPAQGPDTWMTAGVLMLWTLLELHDFTRIVVWGIDGYDEQAEYAPGIKPLDNRPERTPTWCAQQNAHSAECIAAISSHPRYVGKEIIWGCRPRLNMDGWKVGVGV